MQLGAGLVLLDEPTAQLDVRGEAEIFERILAATRHATTILISHRFSTVRHADRICVLEHGRVVELGTHDELMAAGRPLPHHVRPAGVALRVRRRRARKESRSMSSPDDDLPPALPADVARAQARLPGRAAAAGGRRSACRCWRRCPTRCSRSWLKLLADGVLAAQPQARRSAAAVGLARLGRRRPGSCG